MSSVDMDRFAGLFFEHAPRLVRLAAHLGAEDPGEPEEIVRQAFHQLYAAPARLCEEDDTAVSFLDLAVADEVRSRRRRDRVPAGGQHVDGEHPEGEDLLGPLGALRPRRREAQLRELSRMLELQPDPRPVDVQSLFALTRSQIHETHARRRSWLRPLLVATGVAVVVGTAVVVSGLQFHDPVTNSGLRITPVTRSIEGGVADEFTCPSQVEVSFGSGGSLRSELTEGPRSFADTARAARYELDMDGDSATLRLGNADGTLASVHEIQLRGSVWERTHATVCDGNGNMLLPAERADELGDHGTSSVTREQVIGGWAGAVLVDDRQYFDQAGLLRSRAMYAHPCQYDICIATGDGTLSSMHSVPADGRPHDLTDIFLPEDALLDRPPPYAFVAVYDAKERLTSVSWESPSGNRSWVEPVDGPGWTGRIYLVLAPYGDITSVTVHPLNGKPRSYPVEKRS